MPISDDWSYSGDPSDSARDAVRYLIGDTDDTMPLVRDAEIDYALTHQTNVALAAADVATQIAQRLSRMPTIRKGDTTIDWSAVITGLTARAKELRRQAALGAAMPYVGGISRSERVTDTTDTDARHAVFAAPREASETPWLSEDVGC